MRISNLWLWKNPLLGLLQVLCRNLLPFSCKSRQIIRKISAWTLLSEGFDARTDGLLSAFLGDELLLWPNIARALKEAQASWFDCRMQTPTLLAPCPGKAKALMPGKWPELLQLIFAARLRKQPLVKGKHQVCFKRLPRKSTDVSRNWAVQATLLFHRVYQETQKPL